MLGKTNLLFVAEEETAELGFTQEIILTDTEKNFIKIEFVGNYYFAYTPSDEVWYGEDISNLKKIMKDGSVFKPTYIVYEDGYYYMTCLEERTQPILYRTNNFSDYSIVYIAEQETLSVNYYVSSAGNPITVKAKYVPLAILPVNTGGFYFLYKVKAYTSNMEYYSFIEERIAFIENLRSYEISAHKYSVFLKTEYKGGTNLFPGYDTEKLTLYDGRVNVRTSCRVFKNRVFVETNNDKGIKNIMIYSDGASTECEKPGFIAKDYLFLKKSSIVRLYYSLNGIDYLTSGIGDVSSVKSIFEYDGNMGIIYTTVSESKQMFNVFANPKEFDVNSAIPISTDYVIQENTCLYKDDYVYLGCTGGIIIKAKLDYTDTTRPDITVLKTLSAKQALVESKRYTEEKIAALEARILELEEKNT